jgi:propanediol dehydratase small subunit
VVLDLIAEVAADHVKQRAAVDVGRAEELSHVPSAVVLGLVLLRRERVRLIGKVAAENDRV